MAAQHGYSIELKRQVVRSVGPVRPCTGLRSGTASAATWSASGPPRLRSASSKMALDRHYPPKDRRDEGWRIAKRDVIRLLDALAARSRMQTTATPPIVAPKGWASWRGMAVLWWC